MTSLAVFNFAWVPAEFYEVWAAVAGAIFCAVVFAAIHFVHIFILHHLTPQTTATSNKTDAGNGSNGICRVIDASRSPSPDP